MKRIRIYILSLLSAVAIHAQDIVPLPLDPAVSNGVLPNGMKYYIVSNPSLKGMADFALVQKVGPATVGNCQREQIVDMARNALGPKPRLLSATVQDYFSSLGVVPGRKGFVEVTDNATVFRFENVMLSSAPAVLDSTLLVLTEMVASASAYESPLQQWYSPSDHALIVSGDVEPASVAEKIRMLSYMVPSSASVPRGEYRWEENEESQVRTVSDRNRDLSVISATWRLERTPREYMSTVQPIIYERYMSQLGIVAGQRIRKSLESSGVPVADVSYDYVNTIESLGDESFRIAVAVPASDMNHGIAALASVMSRLDAGDVRAGELTRARHIYLDHAQAEYVRSAGNAGYVDRCISAYIYDSVLPSQKETISFHSSRELSDSTEMALFNSIVSSSIDRKRNLMIGCTTCADSIPSERVREMFEDAWDSAFLAGRPEQVLEHVPSLHGPAEKVRVSSSKKEHLSGGTIWTLSNGLKVIFKNMPSDGRIHYSLALNGGYGNMSQLYRGEGAYVSDLLDFSVIGGVDGERFRDVLRRNGMTLDMSVTLSTTVFEGQVDEDGEEYLIRALLTLMNNRRHDKEAFSRFLASEPFRREYGKGEREDRIVAIDSVLCPGYRYTSCRVPHGLKADFAERTDRFMDMLASKANDGVLILAGDIDEKRLKNALLTYAGGFRTQKTAFSRQTVNYQPVSGIMRYVIDGNSDSVDMAMSVPMALTADNYFAAALMSMILRHKLSHAVAGTGMWLTLRHDCRKYPQERLNLMLSLEEASSEGFLPGSSCESPVEALNIVRDAFASPEILEISEAELSSCKSLLKEYFARRREEPQYWLGAIARRYLDGKDFTTGCDEKIDGVTADKVRELITSLGKGSRVEYIINGKKCTTER